MPQEAPNPEVGSVPQAGPGVGAAPESGTTPHASAEAETGTNQAGDGNLSPWVISIIENHTLNNNIQAIPKSHFLNSDPDMRDATQFFQTLNEDIVQANKEHNGPERHGCVPPNNYEIFYEEFVQALTNRPGVEHQQVFKETHQKFAQFNQEYHLPAHWNITQEMLANAQAKILAEFDPDVKSEYSAMADIHDVPAHGNTSGEIPVITIEDDLENLDSLEESARGILSSYSKGEVLFWWKRGTGSQIFVRYGTADHPIYRIRAGSSEPYDPKKVPRIFSIQRGGRGNGWSETKIENPDVNIAQPRGHLKVIEEDEDGEFQENWMYGRANVAGILGVGWKVEDDDDHKQEPLDYLWPEGGDEAIYPFTRILVAWKDKTVTLEDRAFIRRIKRGPTKLADMLIYHKALSSEVLFRQDQGIPFENLLEDLRALKSDRRQKTPGVVQGVMPISESPDPSLPAVRQGVTPDPAFLGVGTPTPGPANTPGPERMNTPGAFRQHTPATAGGNTPSRAARFASILRGSTPPSSQQPRISASPTTPVEDPRDAEIRELKAQLAQLQIAMNPPQPRYNLRSQGQGPVPSWGNQFLPAISSLSPEPSQGRRVRSRKGRGQQSNTNYWSQYAIPAPVYYA
ncbi:hypothetical protein BJX64DRAFT_291122 [Aspergillus heterothallicus]